MIDRCDPSDRLRRDRVALSLDGAFLQFCKSSLGMGPATGHLQIIGTLFGKLVIDLVAVGQENTLEILQEFLGTLVLLPGSY